MNITYSNWWVLPLQRDTGIWILFRRVFWNSVVLLLWCNHHNCLVFIICISFYNSSLIMLLLPTLWPFSSWCTPYSIYFSSFLPYPSFKHTHTHTHTHTHINLLVPLVPFPFNLRFATFCFSIISWLRSDLFRCLQDTSQHLTFLMDLIVQSSKGKSTPSSTFQPMPFS